MTEPKANGSWKLVVCLLTLLAPSGSRAVADSERATTGERVLLLRTGRVVQGSLRQISTGWLVTKQHGHLVIPFDQVRLDADDIEELYLSLRLRLLREPTVGKHLNLADWCLSNKMLYESSLEIRSALSLDPANETARLMLKRLEAQITGAKAASEPSPTPGRAEVRVDLLQSKASDAPDVRSLAGLKSETAHQFVSTIQPILFNRCGNARCHGPSASNGFRLDRFRNGSGSHRLKSERNLAAILEHVDASDPDHSGLLEVTEGSHAGQAVFHGPAAARQSELLTTWLSAATRELYPNAVRKRAKPSPFQPRLPSTLLTATPVEGGPGQPPAFGSDPAEPGSPTDELRGSGIRQLVDAAVASEAPRPLSPNRTAEQPRSLNAATGRQPALRGFQEILNQTENASEPDAFDPDEFNRRYAGRGSTGN